jgi:hypothetical protein
MPDAEARHRLSRSSWFKRIALAGAILAAVACKSSSSTPSHVSSSTTQVSGVVTDSTGAVLSGVTVAGDGMTTTTSSAGTFSIMVSGETKSTVFDFTKTGYIETSKQVFMTAGQTTDVLAAMMPLATPVALDATKGGSVSGSRGATLKADPGVFVDASGKAVTGTVQVSLTPLSPANPGELIAYPGALIGSKNGATGSLLHTYGVLDVTVTQGGQALQVAPGHTVTVNIPVASSGTMPATQDLWSYNLTTGIWDYEGTAQLNGSLYTASLSHFSFHNIDAEVLTGQATCVTGLVVDTSGNPVSGALVSPPEGASVDLEITTGSDGRYCTWVQTGTTETITADSTAAPFAEGTITVTGASTPIPFPGSESCAGLNCATVPNIVLSQPPCKTDSDCSGGASCCSVSGTSECLNTYSCGLASSSSGSGGGGSCTSDSQCSSGETCCSLMSPPSHVCLPTATCTAANSACGSGSITATVSGQTFSFNCFEAIAEGSEGMQVVEFSGSDQGTSGSAVTLEFTSKDNFAGYGAGTMVSLGSDAGSGQAYLVLEGKLSDGSTITLSGTGTITLGSWSTAQSGMISVTIPSGTTLSGATFTDGGANMISGTISGTATAYILP